MKTYPMPKDFSGTKFAARYGLDPLKPDFWSDGKLLYVPNTLPDDPPIFESPDPPVIMKSLEQRISDLEKDIAGMKDGTIKLPK